MSHAVCPAGEEFETYVGVALDALLGLEDLEALPDAWVHLWVSLHSDQNSALSLPAYGT